MLGFLEPSKIVGIKVSVITVDTAKFMLALAADAIHFGCCINHETILQRFILKKTSIFAKRIFYIEKALKNIIK